MISESEKNEISTKKITKKEFVEIYVQLTLLKEEFAEKPKEYKKMKDKFLKDRNLTEQDIFEFAKTYRSNMEYWADIWSEINAGLDSLAVTEKKK